MKYFTADTHFNHQGLLKKNTYAGESGIRAFKTIQEMNDTILVNWNSVIKPGDLVYHLGDFAFPPKEDGMAIVDILDMLNGQLYLIKGNHDDKFKNIEALLDYPSVVKIVDIAYIKLENGQKVMLSHYPMLSWRSSIHGSWHFYGHCHGSLDHPRRYALDVGMDTNDFFPYSERQIINIMKHRSENVNKTQNT